MYIDPPMDPALVKRLAAGVAQAEEGRTLDLGDFRPYADTDEDDPRP